MVYPSSSRQAPTGGLPNMFVANVAGPNNTTTPQVVNLAGDTSHVKLNPAVRAQAQRAWVQRKPTYQVPGQSHILPAQLQSNGQFRFGQSYYPGLVPQQFRQQVNQIGFTQPTLTPGYFQRPLQPTFQAPFQPMPYQAYTMPMQPQAGFPGYGGASQYFNGVNPFAQTGGMNQNALQSVLPSALVSASEMYIKALQYLQQLKQGEAGGIDPETGALLGANTKNGLENLPPELLHQAQQLLADESVKPETKQLIQMLLQLLAGEEGLAGVNGNPMTQIDPRTGQPIPQTVSNGGAPVGANAPAGTSSSPSSSSGTSSAPPAGQTYNPSTSSGTSTPAGTTTGASTNNASTGTTTPTPVDLNGVPTNMRDFVLYNEHGGKMPTEKHNRVSLDTDGVLRVHGVAVPEGYPEGSVVPNDLAYSLFEGSMRKYEESVRETIGAELYDSLSQGEKNAMVSLAMNVGPTGFKQSDVSKYTRDRNTQAAADAFLNHNKARINGELQVLGGLTKRRNRERAAYLQGAQERTQAAKPVANSTSATGSENSQTTQNSGTTNTTQSTNTPTDASTANTNGNQTSTPAAEENTSNSQNQAAAEQQPAGKPTATI